MAAMSRRSALGLGVGVVGTATLKSISVDVPAAAETGGGHSLVWDARDYAVTADGTTDDAPPINSLIRLASSAGGGVVLLPPGTLKVSGPIEMASNVTLRGHGWSSVLRLGTDIAGGGIIQFGPVTNICIEDLKVDGDRLSLTALNNGILGKIPGGFTNVTIRNVWIDSIANAGIAVFGSSTRAERTGNVTIVDCKVSDAGANGIIAQWGVDQCRIERCEVIGFGQERIDCPGIVAGRFAYESYIAGNRVVGTGALGASPHGISLDGVYGGAYCGNNTVLDAVGFGIEVGMVTNGSIVGNTVLGGIRTGIMFTSIGTGEHAGGFDEKNASNLWVTVSGNVVDGTSDDGIGIYMGSPGAGQECPASGSVLRSTEYFASTTNRVIEGRRIYECTVSGSSGPDKPPRWGETELGETIADGTSAWTDRGNTNNQFAVMGNTVRNVGGRGIVLNWVHNATVSGNSISGCGSSEISVEPTANMFAILDNEIGGCNASDALKSCEIAISVYSGCPHVAKISGNRHRDGGVVSVVAIDSTSGARLDDRFAPNSSLPTVAFGNTFKTRNTAPSNVYGLADPNTTEGRVITVLVGDTNTKFVNSFGGYCTLRLFDGIDYLASPGMTIKFMWDSVTSQWVEVFRGDT